MIDSSQPAPPGRPPLVRIARIEVDPAKLDEYRTASRKIVEAAGALEPGVIAFYALEVREVPGRFFVVEVYQDAEAYCAHLDSPHFKTYKSTVAHMVQSLELIETDVVAISS
ncbi:putative quinol monooxygenase [Pseudomonas sp. KFB-139]|uniref:Quinol monooxygenase n=1 Tax=Pseudomonas serbiensis TaxID=3064350 RepID=A0ABT9CUZ0_9PSED|nr:MULTISPECIES: putative quinol monooxygenase [Pseudomonas]MDO7929306.1 putative quinol monooxygenase [Pseudomonas sp. KFB-138]